MVGIGALCGIEYLADLSLKMKLMKEKMVQKGSDNKLGVKMNLYDMWYVFQKGGKKYNLSLLQPLVISGSRIEDNDVAA